jgi:hypothetical protein
LLFDALRGEAERDRQPDEGKGEQRQPPAHPARVRRHPPARGVDQVEPVEQLGHPTSSIVAAEMVQVGHQAQVLLACQQLVPRRELACDPDRGPHSIRIADHVVTGHAHLAGVGRNQRRQDPHDRRLAGAVRPEQREDRARRDLEVDSVEDDLAAERLPQTRGLTALRALDAIAFMTLPPRARRRPRGGS